MSVSSRRQIEGLPKQVRQDASVPLAPDEIPSVAHATWETMSKAMDEAHLPMRTLFGALAVLTAVLTGQSSL